MNTQPALEARHLSKTFHVGFWRKKVEAVRDVSFAVGEQEIFGIVGPNGAGKTTTMKMMTNLIFPDQGGVELFGEPASETQSRRNIGYLPEVPYFYDHLSATELLRYYGALHGMPRRTVDARLDDLLELVGLEDARDRLLRNFSKGMRQRAGIAQALINDPALVILDEPQSGLDPIGRREVRDLIFDLRERGKTVIFSSHILVDVEAVCDRVAVMHEGQLVEVADLDELAEEKHQRIEVTVRNLRAELVDSLDLLLDHTRSGETWRLIVGDESDLSSLLESLVDCGADIREVSRQADRLEDLFLEDVGVSEPC